MNNTIFSSFKSFNSQKEGEDTLLKYLQKNEELKRFFNEASVRSLKFFYAQAIDDQNGHTLAAIDSRKLKKAKSKVEAIREMGETFGKELLKKH